MKTKMVLRAEEIQKQNPKMKWAVCLNKALDETKTQHTPWTVRTANVGKDSITGKMYVDRIIDPLNFVARRELETETEGLKIARLIAAAPELLNALKECYEKLRLNGYSNGKIDYIIAKAEGRE